MLDQYLSIAKALDLPEMTSTQVEIESNQLTSSAELRALLDAHKEGCGWVCFQSRVEKLPLASVPEDVGVPLHGEITVADRSFSFHQDGQGGWLVTVITEGSGESVLADEVVQLSADADNSQMRYRRFWKHNTEHGYMPVAVRFIAFGEG